MKKLIIALTIFLHLNAIAPLAPAIAESLPEPIVEVAKTETDLKQIRCLADNIYHESNGEPEDGQLAVALVTMNRVHTKGFPSSVCGVVYDRCQFSWVCAKRTVNRLTERYKEIHSLAETTYYQYGNMVDFTKRSLYFHATSINPGWKLQRTVRIGRHVFYK